MHDGRYETIVGNDVARDGMFLELWDRPSNELALWAFFSDADGSFEVTRYRADVPPEVEAWFQAEARGGCPQSQTPNQALQQTAGARRLSGVHGSLGPRRCC